MLVSHLLKGAEKFLACRLLFVYLGKFKENFHLLRASLGAEWEVGKQEKRYLADHALLFVRLWLLALARSV
jgi:hypothetical protein